VAVVGEEGGGDYQGSTRISTNLLTQSSFQVLISILINNMWDSSGKGVHNRGGQIQGELL
jgi:hypothetical protein